MASSDDKVLKKSMRANSPRRIRKGEPGHGKKKCTIRFGDAKMSIKRDDPKRRKNFRSRHGCDKESAKDKLTAKYWSCYQWRSGSKVKG